MHEASIAYELLNIATRECGRNGYSKIQSIKVIVGRASGVMTDALLFAFNVLKEGTPAQDAELIVEEIPVKGFAKNVATSSQAMNPIWLLSVLSVVVFH